MAAGALAAGALAQWRFRRSIANDPAGRELEDPPSGEPVRTPSADGTTIYAEAFGPEDGMPVVLAHGWTENLSFWVHVIRGLSERGFRVVAYDLRGHGQSEGAGDYSIDRFGEDLEAVLGAAVPDGRRALVAGHSLGAMSIAAWAEHHEVQRLVGAAALLNTGVGDLLAEQLLVPLPGFARALNQTLARHGFMGSRAPLPRFSTPLAHLLLRRIAFGPNASPAQVAYFERMVIGMPPRTRSNVGLAISEIELYDALPRLTVPAIVLAGEKDRLTPPSHARRIAEMLPQLDRLIILPETGHMAPLERPAEVTEALLELAAKVGQPASGSRDGAEKPDEPPSPSGEPAGASIG